MRLSRTDNAHLAGIVDRFAAAMRRLGPFEPRPCLAVAVSGGPDSMALALLADGWARRRRGRIVALVVDHGLRPESRAESRTTRRRLAALGIDSRLLAWRGDKPATGIQAAARAARYALLEGWCARHGVLHLLTGHQRDDQAETVMLRRDRGSGPDGLAGIAAIVEREHVRVLRPLLAVPRRALQSWLRAHDVAWVDDPSNANPAFARTAIRAALSSPAGRDAGPSGLARTAARHGAARRALDAATARLLGRHVAVYPQGFACLPRAALAVADPAIARRALVQILGCVGGAPYPPREERLQALLTGLRGGMAFRGATLAGCRLVPQGAGGDTILVVREVRPGVARRSAAADAGLARDGRFRLVLPAAAATGRSRMAIAALGEDGWASVVRHRPALRKSAIPAAVRRALPALRDRAGVLCVPHLGYGRASRKAASLTRSRVVFRPARMLSSAGFSVA